MAHVSRKLWPAGIALSAVVVAGVLAAGRLAPGRVSGQTSQDRIDCVCRLADEKGRSAGDAIAACASGDADPAVRAVAMKALANVAAPSHRAIVEKGLEDRDAGVRAAAAMTLGRFDDEPAARRLGRVLRGGEEEAVLLAAVAGLCRQTTDAALRELVEAAELNRYPAVRRQALAGALERIGMGYDGTARPEDPAAWSRLMARVKKMARVRKAMENTAAREQIP